MSQLETLNSFFCERLMAVAAEIFQAVKNTLSEYQNEIERSKQEVVYLRRRLAEVSISNGEGCQCSCTDGIKKHCSNPELLDSEPSVIQVKVEVAALKQECEPHPTLNNRYMCTSNLAVAAHSPEPTQDILERAVSEENMDSFPHFDSADSVKAESVGSQVFSSGKAGNELVNSPYKDEQDTLSCSFCDKTFFEVAHLALHLETHKVLFTCELCGKSFKKKGTLKTHMVVHQKDRPFRCKLCHKSYSCAKILNVHLISHTEERPFGCGYCEKHFKLKSHLKEHERIHTGEKPFICPVCRKCFSRSNALKKHVRKQHHEQLQLLLDQ